MKYSIPIPKRSQAAFDKHHNLPKQNPGLIFDRYAPDWGQETQFKQKQDDPFKKQGLDTVREAATRADADLLIAWKKRWRHTAAAVGAVPFKLKTDWRFIAGLGRKGPLEVGFTFNRYGFPIIPGSSLKGVARAWAFYQITEGLEIPPKLWKDLETTLLGEPPSKEKGQADWRIEMSAWAAKQQEAGKPGTWQELIEATLLIQNIIPLEHQQNVERHFGPNKPIKVWILDRNRKRRLQLTMKPMKRV